MPIFPKYAPVRICVFTRQNLIQNSARTEYTNFFQGSRVPGRYVRSKTTYRVFFFAPPPPFFSATQLLKWYWLGLFTHLTSDPMGARFITCVSSLGRRLQHLHLFLILSRIECALSLSWLEWHSFFHVVVFFFSS